MEDYQIFIIVFSSMTTIFLCCALPALSKTCISNPSVRPSLIQNNNRKYSIKNIIKHIKKIKNIKKITYLPEEQATNECV
jgi:cell division protein FtsX